VGVATGTAQVFAQPSPKAKPPTTSPPVPLRKP
jgi:hypothetical protein